MNAIGAQFRDVINSGLIGWRLVVQMYTYRGEKRGKGEEPASKYQ